MTTTTLEKTSHAWRYDQDWTGNGLWQAGNPHGIYWQYQDSTFTQVYRFEPGHDPAHLGEAGFGQCPRGLACQDAASFGIRLVTSEPELAC